MLLREVDSHEKELELLLDEVDSWKEKLNLLLVDPPRALQSWKAPPNGLFEVLERLGVGAA